jgi:hypothetical protein
MPIQPDGAIAAKVFPGQFHQTKGTCSEGRGRREHTQHWGSASVAVCVRQAEVSSPGPHRPRLRGQLLVGPGTNDPTTDKHPSS